MEFFDILLLILAIGCVLALAYYFLISPRIARSSMKTFLTYATYFAHRGLHDEDNPENSLPAFRRAVEHGYGIELDVQVSKDGIPVVFHDDNMKRGTGVDKGIYSHTVEELKALPLFGREDLSIPTLAEVLEVVDGKVPLVVEVKASQPEWRETLRETMKLLENYEGPYCIESFNPLVLRELRHSYPAVLRGQLCEHFGASFKAAGKNLPAPFFAAERFWLNAIAKPDFIAYNCRHTGFFHYRLMTRLFPECTFIAWTTRKPEDEKTSRSFEAYIFEDYLPPMPQKEDAKNEN